MKLGIKTGLKSNWQSDLVATKPDFCEIWFDINRKDQYRDLFEFLKGSKIRFGLHFWGANAAGILANIAYPDQEILQSSRQLIKKTIDIASIHRAFYVNLHASGKRLTTVDFDQEKFIPLTKSADLAICRQNLAESLMFLAGYARRHGVQLLLESTPKLGVGHPWRGKAGRLKPVDTGEFPVDEILFVFDVIKSIGFTNDFGHTASLTDSATRTFLLESLFSVSRRLLPRTKLLHVSYIIPPYNGTDYHGSLTYPEFNSDQALPNRTEMLKLLKIYLDQDVCALVEPESNHTGNFIALKQLINQLQSF